MTRGLGRACVLLGLACASVTGAPLPRLETWRRDGGRMLAEGGAEDAAVSVGSLQKPFVAKAWAAAHPDQPTPRFRCSSRSGCWLRRGHGDLGLARAVALSCNSYFRALAADTPASFLRWTLTEEGFLVTGSVTPEAAVGLADTVVIPPRRLLEAYVRLTRTPWLTGEPVRREVLSGLRQAALDGTAQGLGRRGYWAKTGTVDARGRADLETVGWALAVDDSGWAILGRLQPGTGREAAQALRISLQRHQPTPAPPPSPEQVRVLLFEAFRPRSLIALNRGGAPVAGSRGFVGSGGAVSLRPGDRLGVSLWELSLPDRRLVRRVRAALSSDGGGGGRLEVVAEMDTREYVSGVIAAELPGGDEARRVALGAAALRFRSRGPRHANADFCDTTHCAWFIGRGPRVRWPEPERALLDVHSARPVDAAEWSRMLEDSRSPGPFHWTSHCGGRPLSAHTLWGNHDQSVVSCPLHRSGPSRPWTRTWPDAALERAFGGRVRRLEVGPSEGVYHLEVVTTAGTQRLLYDEAHRLLAGVLGWGAMPSPPDRVVRLGNGFRAEGVGLGHRVGLCLGEPPVIAEPRHRAPNAMTPWPPVKKGRSRLAPRPLSQGP